MGSELSGMNSALQIIRLNGQKFAASQGYYVPTGYCFYHPNRGYLALKGSFAPYVPQGGKSALQSILEGGGFCSLEGVSFIQSVSQALYSLPR